MEVKFFTSLQKRLIDYVFVRRWFSGRVVTICQEWLSYTKWKLSCSQHCIQVIKNIRNVTRHRNGQSVKSRQTRWEWQLLISIMHIHDVMTRYNNCAFLCAWHVNITVFFALPPCCVDESYVCVPKLYWWMIM